MTLWVLKIGTSLLRGSNIFSTKEIIDEYCSCISECKRKGDKVILVSSGAVGLGCSRLGIKKRPEDLKSLQAAAAVGQGYLMSLYEKAMNKHGYNVAQILLTRADFSSRVCYQNASLTLKRLLDWSVLPIVNENDTISNEELLYGDNDTLSALVATSISANQLVLLTDIDKLYSADPKNYDDAKPITDVHTSKDLSALQKISKQSTSWGTGGIKTKLIAAKIATESGIKVQLADGRDPAILSNIFTGARGGTVFHPHKNPLGNRKSWLAHAIVPQGIIELDNGAIEAIEKKGASLLLVGIKKLKGNFSANQPVSITNEQGLEIARGISSLSSDIIHSQINHPLSSTKSPVVIHRDVLVLTGEKVV